MMSNAAACNFVDYFPVFGLISAVHKHAVACMHGLIDVASKGSQKLLEMGNFRWFKFSKLLTHPRMFSDVFKASFKIRHDVIIA